MLAGGPGDRDRVGDQPVVQPGRQVGQRGAQRDDAALGRGVLVADRQPAEPVVHRGGQPGGADVVVGVHRRDHPEGGLGRRPCPPAAPRSARSAIAVSSVFRVSSGARLNSSMYRKPPVAHGLQQRAVDEVVRAVVLAQHPGRVVVPDQLGRGEVGVALDEDERDAPLGGDRPQQRGLAGAGRSLEDDVAAGRDGREHEGQLPLAADQVRARTRSLGVTLLEVRRGRSSRSAHLIELSGVDRQRHPGDVAGLVGGQEQHRVGDVAPARPTGPAARSAPEPLGQHLPGALVSGQVRANSS